jgi:hypothetical protein
MENMPVETVSQETIDALLCGNRDLPFEAAGMRTMTPQQYELSRLRENMIECEQKLRKYQREYVAKMRALNPKFKMECKFIGLPCLAGENTWEHEG